MLLLTALIFQGRLEWTADVRSSDGGLLCFVLAALQREIRPDCETEKMIKQTTRRRQGSDYIEYIL
jgi:hypothetical protein